MHWYANVAVEWDVHCILTKLNTNPILIRATLQNNNEGNSKCLIISTSLDRKKVLAEKNSDDGSSDEDFVPEKKTKKQTQVVVPKKKAKERHLLNLKTKIPINLKSESYVLKVFCVGFLFLISFHFFTANSTEHKCWLLLLQRKYVVMLQIQCFRLAFI
jgi:hypothetical protein